VRAALTQWCYVRRFVAAKIDNPARVEAWTDRVMNEIAATRSGYPWPRNLRELKNYTERYLLTAGHVFQVAPSAPASPPAAPSPPASPPAAQSPPEGPESTSPPSTKLMWQKAMAGELSVAELISGYVTWVHFLNNLNKAETARKTGLGWRTVTQKLDFVRLLRWLQKASKKR
jgi:DNA-binding NtrC family response regulator